MNPGLATVGSSDNGVSGNFLRSTPAKVEVVVDEDGRPR